MTRIVILLAAFIATIVPAHADFAAGFAAYSRGDYEIAVNEWRSVADEGNVKAQVGLGFMYEKGLGVPQDFTKAVRWYRLAADQNDSIAQYNLGVMYGNGTGVLQDYVEAHRLFSISATRGNEDAKNSLSYIEKLMTPSQLALAQENSVEVAVLPADSPAQPPENASPAPQVAAAVDPAPVPEPAPVPAPAAPVQSAKARPATPLVNTVKALTPDVTPILEPADVTPVVESASVTPVVEPAKISPQIATVPKAAEVAPVAYDAPAAATQVTSVAKEQPAVAAPINTETKTPKIAEKPAVPVVAQDQDSVQIAAKPAASKAIQESDGGPWQVHLVSLQNGSAVEGEWRRLLKRHPDPLGTLSLTVQEIDIPEKGHFFRLLAGSFESEATAQSACAALKAQDQYCRPMRR